MLSKVYCAALVGIDATLVTVEVNLTKGCLFTMVGLPDSTVRESHERILSALEAVGYKMPIRKTLINLAPADLRKEGASYDLPIAVAMLTAEGVVPTESVKHVMVCGELSLDGSILPVRGALPVAILARQEGFDTFIVPEENVREAAVVDKVKVYGASNLLDVIKHLKGEELLTQTVIDTRAEFFSKQDLYDIDFSDVKGQEHVKRALEVAASGGHNILLVGSPGSGKSMMSKRLPTILPPLSLSESLETTKIHSVAGKLGKGTSLITQRPFRAPHHTISQAALAGGGAYPQAGELSLASNGILFLDELPEFPRQVLEILRQPLEDRKISISRAKWSVEYPANFTLVAAMNPCPCGYYNDPTRECVCTPGQVQRYLSKISGPLLDRIDIQVEIVPVPFEKLADNRRGECSQFIRERVIKARDRQQKRYADYPNVHCNAQMTPKLMEKYARLDASCLKILRQAMERLNLSARAYDRILKVARTIADIADKDQIEVSHIAEAIGYRNLDRDHWGN